MGFLARLVRVDRLDHKVPCPLQECLDLLEPLARRDLPVPLETVELRELLVPAETREPRVNLESMSLAPLDLLEDQEPRELPERRATRVLSDSLAVPEGWALVAPLDPRDPKETPTVLVAMEAQALRVLWECLAFLDHLDVLATMVCLDPRVRMVARDHVVSRDLLDAKELLVLLA